MLAAILAGFLGPVAQAKDTGAFCTDIGCQVHATRPAHDGSQRRPSTGHSQSPSDRKLQRLLKADEARYRRDLAYYNYCLRYMSVFPTHGVVCGGPPKGPNASVFDATRVGKGPVITPEQAALVAVARLRLPAVKPGIGPSPDLNRWQMAAVGYPLWLWADGPGHVGPVSDSVGGLTVSLDARLGGVSFRMGDGHRVECVGRGTRWSRAVEPDAKSPTCGYAYSRPSLPQGDYTVAAVSTWAVRWTAAGESGVITVPTAGTTQLPVGELQVLEH